MSIMMSCGCRSQSTNAKSEPSCPTHFDMPGGIHPIETPNLAGRKARCACGKLEDSSLDLTFFEFRGLGSMRGARTCKNCRFYDVAHTPEKRHKNKHICQNFEALKEFEFDSYYCGCSGWD